MKYEDSEIILIEYFDNIPHSVYTYDAEYSFDMYGDNRYLMFHESGSGYFFSDKTIVWDSQLAFPEKTNAKLWVNSNYKIKVIYPGYEIIKLPIIIDGKENPFEYGNEVSGIVYCEKCELFWNEDGCPEHGWPDERLEKEGIGLF